MVLPEESPANTAKRLIDWCAIASLWQNAETGPGICMYDYGEADQGRCGLRNQMEAENYLKQTEAGCLMQAVTGRR
jgi:hypothetical protein